MCVCVCIDEDSLAYATPEFNRFSQSEGNRPNNGWSGSVTLFGEITSFPH